MPMPTKAPSITWERICRLNPLMRNLYEEAKSIKDDKRKKRFCANVIWENQLKPYMVNHVGWNSPIPELRSSLVYNITYEKIYNALPNCRNCFCVGMGNWNLG